jgi:hypothetical protein
MVDLLTVTVVSGPGKLALLRFRDYPGIPG